MISFSHYITRKSWLLISLAAISLILTLVSCQPEENNNEIHIIDFESIYQSGERQYPLSNLVSSVEYVRLEILSECIVGEATGIAVSDNYILIYDIRTQRVLLFNKDGKYLHDIGSRGKGPGEYNDVDGKNLSMVNNKQMVLFTGYSNEIYLYNIKYVGPQ